MILLKPHEALIAEHLILQKIKDSHFHDFEGVTKSLGAWGGDFALAASDKDEGYIKEYFQSKGFSTVLSYDQMLLPTEELSPV